MATYTDNYHLSKPETTDSQQSFIEDYATNMEIIDENMGGGSGGGGHTIVNPAGTDMAQEPKMQFAGKVSVTDDSTNEKTVVTLPEEVKEVTLAEYEALPDSKLTDGKAYFIKDLDNPSVEGYPPLIYSDEEREVGVWIDGKPLYQKSFYASNVTVNSWQSITHGISNLENIAKTVGEYKRDSDGLSFPVNYYESNSAFIAVQTNNTTIDYKVNGITTGSLFITLQYTKTTDVAGSGTWNGQGGLAHHYSTSETVVGTWIDGKPVYEKTFNVNTSIAQNITYVVGDITGFDIVNVSGIALTSSASGFNIPYYNDASEQAQLWWSSNELKFYQKGYTITGLKITIQYTKTTD